MTRTTFNPAFSCWYLFPWPGVPLNQVGLCLVTRVYFVITSVSHPSATTTPAVRYVYDVAPQIPTLVFSVAYYAIAAAGLGALLLYENRTKKFEDSGLDTQSSLRGGMELGTYLFLGNAFQVFGLRTVPSDRAAFLLQLTTIFVPFLQAILAGSLKRISNRVWLASGTALAGVAVISLDGAKGTATTSALDQWTFSGGDALIVAAAVLYTFHCVRLELYAQTTSAVRLALTKAVTEMSWSLVAALCLVFLCSSMEPPPESSPDSILSTCVTSGESIKSFVSSFAETVQTADGSNAGLLAAGAATTWIGLITVAYTICAQSYGQKYVKAATANLIYTIQPLYTAFFAWILLGETLGPLGYTGGAIILSAVLLVAVEEQ